MKPVEPNSATLGEMIAADIDAAVCHLEHAEFLLRMILRKDGEDGAQGAARTRRRGSGATPPLI